MALSTSRSFARGWRGPDTTDFTKWRSCRRATGGGAIPKRCSRRAACGTRPPASSGIKTVKITSFPQLSATRTFNGPKPSFQDRRSHGRQGQRAARCGRIERHLREALQSVGVESSEANRRAYRDLLFTAKGIEEFVSGVILFDETLRQSTVSGNEPF